MITYFSVFVQDQSRWVRVNFLGVYIHVVGGVINHCYVRYDMLVVRGTCGLCVIKRLEVLQVCGSCDSRMDFYVQGNIIILII